MVPLMERGIVHIYTGDGRGKSPAALGRAVQAAAAGEQVVIIQFLKGKGLEDIEFVRRLEPEIKLFRFEKSDEFYEELPEEKKAEEDMNIRNGMNFAKKVLSTRDCDVLILDEILGLLDYGIIEPSDIQKLMEEYLKRNATKNTTE